jgi:L-alanine-DL-glutamate epimerase-like enolase superfamily enzyme
VVPAAKVERVRASAYRIPTDFPEADGTLEWSDTTLVVVEITALGTTGLGYTYASAAAAFAIVELLAKHVAGGDASSPRANWDAMIRAVRNNGRRGLLSMAISAVDCSLWDLKARLLGISVLELIGATRDAVPVYGSGGFTSYSEYQLQRQLQEWVDEGISAVKMKVGGRPECDAGRVGVARKAIGERPRLFVDANGAYDRKQALQMARRFQEYDVTWFEEPVSSDDLEGLHLLRDLLPMEIAAGEYGYEQAYFRQMMASEAVDVVQVDATRCGGVTGFLKAAEEIDGFGWPLSAHTAPSLHGYLCCAVPRARHVEYFHDHVRIENMLFDGALVARQGYLQPDKTAPGFGLTLKAQDAEKFSVYQGEVNA